MAVKWEQNKRVEAGGGSWQAVKVNTTGVERLYSRPLVSEQRQELGHSVILVHLETAKEIKGRGRVSGPSTVEAKNRTNNWQIRACSHSRNSLSQHYGGRLKQHVVTELPQKVNLCASVRWRVFVLLCTCPVLFSWQHKNDAQWLRGVLCSVVSTSVKVKILCLNVTTLKVEAIHKIRPEYITYNSFKVSDKCQKTFPGNKYTNTNKSKLHIYSYLIHHMLHGLANYWTWYSAFFMVRVNLFGLLIKLFNLQILWLWCRTQSAKRLGAEVMK